MSARKWLEAQKGRKPAAIAKSYRKWYGVDWPCAIRELTSLGVRFPKAWVAQLKQSLEKALQAKARRKAEREAANRSYQGYEGFAYIAGYTEGGAPYGVTWDELRTLSPHESSEIWESPLEEIPESSHPEPEPDELWDSASRECDGILDSASPKCEEFWEWSLREPDEIWELPPPEPDELRGGSTTEAEAGDVHEMAARTASTSAGASAAASEGEEEGADCPF